MKKLALVTGGAGFIGSHLTDVLVGRGWDVAILDDLSTGSRKNVSPGATLHVVDIRKPAAAALVRKLKPAAVFHLGAQVSVTESLKRPAKDIETNLLATTNLLEASADVGVKRFVFASSAAVFGTLDVPLPTDESATVAPASPYGITKYAGERFCAFYRSARKLPTVALRFANVYGPRQSRVGEAGVIAVFAKRMLAKQAVAVNGDGTQTRDFVYVTDVVDAMLAALDRPKAAGPYHIGTGVETTIRDLFTKMTKETGYRSRARKGPKDRDAVVRSALDARRAKLEIGWMPKVGLDEGLHETVAWFREQA
ncbi:NAD-dependent epimerase/dehydratase family protein [Candidatus Uhrbacteria bacterium]|nr:NAD-dependent epimerase/dehydratase family protein [Candidatus Uhrbacteria bacterium]